MNFDLGEKELNMSNIVQCSILVLAGTAMVIGSIWAIFSEITEAEIAVYFFAGFIGLFGLAMTLVFGHEIFYGKLYKAYGYIPVKEFQEVKNYKNGIMFVVDDYAWKFYNAKDEIAKLESIQFVQYFNIKGKSVQYVLTPYNQLTFK